MRQSLRLFMAVTNYRVCTNISHKFDKKNCDTPSRSTPIEPTEPLLPKIGQTMFELVRRSQNIDVFMINLIRAARDLVESQLFKIQRIAFSGGKIGHF